MLLRIAGDQPISEVISDPNVTFNLGILFGVIVGIIFGIFVYACYKDIKES